MLKNFIKLSVRYITKNKIYTFINVTGLALSLATFYFILVWLMHELSYDHFQKDQVFRIVGKVTTDSETFSQAVTPPPLAPELVRFFPEVIDATRIGHDEAIVHFGNHKWVEENILLADTSFFDVFNFKLLQGQPDRVLDQPYQVVISASIAQKYFGEQNPLGQTMQLSLYNENGSGSEYTITGVIEDCPENSHFTYQMLISFSTFEKFYQDSDLWFWNGFYTYLLLYSKDQAPALQAKLPEFADHYLGEKMQEYQMFYQYAFQPIKKIYLHSKLRYENGPTGNIYSLIIFASIGLIILLLATINYINLSTALYLSRLKEVMVRKALGAQKIHIIGQQLIESMVMVILAFLLALILTEPFKPVFNQISGEVDYFRFQSEVLLLLAAVVIFIGLISGIFPAGRLIQNRFSQKHWKFKSNDIFSRVLTTIQFLVTVILVSSVLIINRQLQFIHSSDLGFNKDQIVTLKVNGSQQIMDHFEVFRQEMLTYPVVDDITRSNSAITTGLGNSLAFTENQEGKAINSSIYRLLVDHQYFSTYGIRLLAGRNFLINNPSDTIQGFVVNQEAVKIFGWEDASSAIGKPFSMMGQSGKIIGVVENFHFNTLKHPIGPLAMALIHQNFSQISIRFNSSNPQEIIERLQALWQKHFPDTLFDYAFLDDTIYQQYRAEQNFLTLFKVFSVISLVLAGMGLFAMVSFHVTKRLKEMGIRKVLGANMGQIIVWLNHSFIKMIILAIILAVPISYWLMTAWLHNFIYHASITISIYLFSGLVVLLVSFIIAGYHSIKAASINATEILKDE
ncbi:MAG: ABC transporter permease [Candidatus Cyclobacteriaceae bacterium M3_2C_046]